MFWILSIFGRLIIILNTSVFKWETPLSYYFLHSYAYYGLVLCGDSVEISVIHAIIEIHSYTGATTQIHNFYRFCEF